MEKIQKSIDLNICKKTIIYGAILRVILTFGTFWIISKYVSSSYLFIVLPIILGVLDLTDNIPSFIYSWNQGYYKDKCTKLFNYQSIDKINDLAAYVLAWYWFDLKSHPLFLIFCGLRAFGVLGFIWTRKTYPLMIFPDLLKEFLIYRYFIPQGFNWLPAIIIAKIGFEVFFHGINNPSSY